MRLSYSTVTGATDNRPVRVDSTWGVLVKKLGRVEPRGKYSLREYLELSTAAKAKAKAGPAWIPGTFKKGGKRLDAHLKHLSCFVGDVDNKNTMIGLKQIVRALRGYEAVIHTTYSHSRETPKFRFVVPYKEPIEPKDHARVFHFFNARLGGALDPKGKTPSQLYYWPSCPPDAVRLFRFEHLEGKPLDLGEVPAVVKPAEKKDHEVKIPKKLPKVNLKKLGLSARMIKLIETGEDSARKYVSRSEAIFAVVLAMLSHGASDAQVASVLLNPGYAISEKVLEQRNPQRYVKTTLKKARGSGFVGDVKTVEEVIADMNARHAVVRVGGKSLILTEGEDPLFDGRRSIDLGTIFDLRLQYANRRLVINEKSVCIADIWLQHEDRRQYERIVFSPDRDIPGHYNLWRGFAVKPAPGDCSLYLQHIRDNIAQGDEEIYRYLIGYMADAVQKPGRLPGVAIVMRGEEGVGKGIFVTEFGKLFGQHFVHVSNARHLVGNFNAHLKDALVVFADEAFWAGDKGSQGVLNAMITEESRVLEFKGKDPIPIRNYVRLFIASNHDWVVPANLSARRFCVIDVGSNHMQDRPYFAAIRRQMDKGGRAALLHYLMNYDLSGFDIGDMPRTEALVDQQIRSMTPIEQFWLDRLKRGEQLNNSGKWLTYVKCSTLYDQFVASSQKTGGSSRRASETELGISLHRLCPIMKRRRRRSDDNWKSRAYYYVFPSLAECRAAFEERIRAKINWKQ